MRWVLKYEKKITLSEKSKKLVERGIVPPEIDIILEAIEKENGKAALELRNKCNWEKMSKLAVILCWGDPREW